VGPQEGRIVLHVDRQALRQIQRKVSNMSAYLVYLCQSVNDRKELETYWDKINSTFEGVDIKLLSAYGAAQDR
jgi:hypothetical protein